MQSRGLFQKQLKSPYSNLFLLHCQPQTSEVFVLRCCWQTEPSPLSVLPDAVCAWVNMTWLLFRRGISCAWEISHTMTPGIKVNLARSESSLLSPDTVCSYFRECDEQQLFWQLIKIFSHQAKVPNTWTSHCFVFVTFLWTKYWSIK